MTPDETLAARYQKDPAMVYREIAGEAILVPIRNNVGDLESIYTLNESAAFAWSLFDGQRSLGEICAEMAREYEVSEAEARQDLLELAAQLLAVGALAEAD